MVTGAAVGEVTVEEGVEGAEATAGVVDRTMPPGF